MSYTPGPWKANVGQDLRGWLIGPAARYNDFAVAPVALLPTAFRREPEASFNARLIAAAPELLAALQQVETMLSDHPDAKRGNSKVTFLMYAARAAIAKAEGRAA